ncbi:uncharacterized protein LY89DRAFT_764570 [Mollisia scopiformis]|uniref:Plasma membrane proteolipid 3 n=1 Tax=Mollisia scopiformis TaxID=149040 RepID=A0A132B995_MOLSC|nr:uncharacterized protein LY89DRAFT_764570 [Mollisia scopiformis]KUJ08444.1 hypothetical protein LY89DRAFT_764570 [Mollisia scopiformis]
MANSQTTQLVIAIIITIICPFAGTFIVAGCGPDGFITLVLCLCGYLPGIIHALYVVITWNKRAEARGKGIKHEKEAPIIFSERVQMGLPMSCCDTERKPRQGRQRITDGPPATAAIAEV